MKTREFINGNSNLSLTKLASYKATHINNGQIALIWYDSKNRPLTGTDYYPVNDAEDFIIRNIKFHKYLGKVEIISVNEKSLTIGTLQGIKTVDKHVFLQNVVNSIEEWVGKEELERYQFNERIDNTEKLN